MKHARKYVEAVKKILPDTLYPVNNAFKLVRETSITESDATVEVAMRLGVNPHKAGQLVHGTVNLPYGTGKTMHILVFAVGEKAADARAAGTDEVGGDKLIEEVPRGYTDFDVAMATPDLVDKVGCSGKVLGLRGLIPNPRTDTVTMNMARATGNIRGGRIGSRVDKHADLQFVVGKISFNAEKLAEDYRTVLKEVMCLHPSTVKGHCITRATISTTAGSLVPLVLVKKREA